MMNKITHKTKSTFLLMLCFVFGIGIANSQNENSPLSTNLGGIEPWTSESVFVNIANQSYGWFRPNEALAWDDFIDPSKVTTDNYLATGESGTLSVVWGSATPVVGDYILTYTGDYTVSFPYTNGVSITSNTAGRVEYTATNAYSVAISFTANSGSATLGAVRLVKDADEFNTNNFSSTFTDDLVKFKSLRFMDFMETNNSDIVTLSEYPSGTSLFQRPLSIEYIVALSNRLNTNPWICFPIEADDAFVTSWADYMANNVDAGLTPKIELSNEVWNGGFTQYSTAATLGGALPGANGTQWEDAPLYYGHRSAQIHDIFQTAFDAKGKDFCRLVAWQAANSWFLTQRLLPEYKNTATSGFGPSAIAIAPYFGGHLGHPDHTSIVPNFTEAQLFEEIFHGTYIGADPGNGVYGAIDQSIGWVASYKTLADSEGADLLCYEAGQHLAGIIGNENNTQLTTLFTNANRSSRMKDAYLEYFIRMKDAGMGEVALFTSHGSFSKWGSWGFKEKVGQADNVSPKFLAALEFIDSYTATYGAGGCSYSAIAATTVVSHFKADKQLICPDSDVQFTDLSEGSPTDWLWDFGDGTATSNAQSPLHHYVAAGSYAVTLTVTLGGDSHTIVKTSFIEAAGASNIINQQPVSVTKSETRQVKLSIGAVGESLTYQWKKDGVDIDGADQDTFIIPAVAFSDAGDYTCVATTACGFEVSNTATLTVQTNNSVKYEAECATFSGNVAADTSLAGYSGLGHTDRATFTAGTDIITFSVNVETAGNYTLDIAHRNDEGGKDQFVSVNGTEVYTSFPQTAGWAELEYGTISLNAGTNTIKLRSSWGWMAFDYIVIDGTIPPGGTYSLTPSALNGMVAVDPVKALYNANEIVKLIPIADSGYEFDNWTGDVTSTNDPLLFNMTSNVAVTANFSVSGALTEHRFEAEGATLEVVTVNTDLAGYSGTGHTDRSFPGGSKITFSITANVAKAYSIKLTYYNDGDKYQVVKVNGVALSIGGAGEVGFLNSGSTWEEFDLGDIDLIAGVNTIEISSSWGWTAFDFLSIYTTDSADIEGAALGIGDNTLNPAHISMYPNPVSEAGFTINVTDPEFNNNALISMMDISGRMLLEKKMTSNSLKIDNDLSQGIYFVRISYNGKQLVQRIIFK